MRVADVACLMQVSSITAGMLHFGYHSLVLAIIGSSVIYDGALITLGFVARLGLKRLSPEYAAWIVFGAMVMIIALFAIAHLVRRRSKQV